MKCTECNNEIVGRITVIFSLIDNVKKYKYLCDKCNSKHVKEAA